MSGTRIGYTLDDKDYRRAVQQLGGVLHARILPAIGTTLVEVVQKRFESAKEPFGAAWKPLSPGYAAIKKGPGILRASRMLQRSVAYLVSGNKITIGSNRIYAAVHQFGATIKPVRAKALAFKMGGAGKRGGVGLVRAKSVTIPARPYLGFGPADQRAVMEVLNDFVHRTLGS